MKKYRPFLAKRKAIAAALAREAASEALPKAATTKKGGKGKEPSSVE